MNLVTGASGFIGGRIVRALIQRGEDVRILARPDAKLSGLSGLKYETCLGDIVDRTALQAAVKGCKRIYHAAALYKLWVKNPERLYQINVTGTENIIQAGINADVERIIYTSSVSTIGMPQDGSGNEETPVRLEDMVGDYKRSKFLAEASVKKLVDQGAPVVIVNPTYPVGEGDVKPTPSGQVIVDFLKKRMPAYLDTGMNVIDVDDVAKGHLLAADNGQIGRRYILGNRNMTLKEILDILSDISGLPGPRIRLPYYPVLGLSYIDAALARMVPHREPRIPPDGVKMARNKMYVDTSRAVNELKLPQTLPRVALEKAVNWFRSEGYV